jgi:hypothetical protein
MRAAAIASRSQPLACHGVARKGGGQHLDGHVPIESCVARSIDVAHSASADGATISYGPRQDPVGSVITRSTLVDLFSARAPSALQTS